jgi:AmmeMemoRadiSam system protein A
MLSRSAQIRLLQIADAAIEFGLEGRRAPQTVNLDQEPEELRELTASFVTLYNAGNLRGCIGSLIPHRPLVSDVAANAFAAAFLDPRFPALSSSERPAIAVSISVLSPLTPIAFVTAEDLYATLRVGIDGIVLSHQNARATFLPEVWGALPDPRAFIRELRLKAGIPEQVPLSNITVSRYATHSFSGVAKLGTQTRTD